VVSGSCFFWCSLTAVRVCVNVCRPVRLLQLRDELVHSTSDSPAALAERVKQLQRDIMEEEQRAAQETAELADQLARAREDLLAEREHAERKESGLSWNLGAAARAPHSDHRHSDTSNPAHYAEYSSEQGGVGIKERARFDAAFIAKVQDVKRRLQDTRCVSRLKMPEDLALSSKTEWHRVTFSSTLSRPERRAPAAPSRATERTGSRLHLGRKIPKCL
jgi:hypothetical protein